LVASDFIALARPDFPLPGHHSGLLANCLAQSSALAFGQTADEAQAAGIPAHLLPFRTFPGNQPSTTIVLPELTPFSLGQLIALYEHKVFCLGVLWNLNSFDQWGVELGKHLAGRLAPCLRGEATADGLDASTRGLIAHLRDARR
jgi:glucose-6-phosphate isomerase